jgi:hypothetical protein
MSTAWPNCRSREKQTKAVEKSLRQALTAIELFRILFPAAFSATFAGARLAPLFTAAATTLFSAAFVFLVYGCPRAPLSFLGADSALLVTFLDMISFPFLLRSVFLFASSCHT